MESPFSLVVNGNWLQRPLKSHFGWHVASGIASLLSRVRAICEAASSDAVLLHSVVEEGALLLT